MKCYEHAKQGKDVEAVAVCAICGMGVCIDHLVEREVPLVHAVSGWASETAMQILCQRCAQAATTA